MIVGLRIAMAALASISASGVAQAQQFDLLCEGTMQSDQETSRPATFRLIIDLDARRWCWQSNCTEHTSEIESVSPNEIVFFDYQTRTDVSLTVGRGRVNRITGELFVRRDFATTAGHHSFMERQGTCRRHPFSGFPATQF